MQPSHFSASPPPRCSLLTSQPLLLRDAAFSLLSLSSFSALFQSSSLSFVAAALWSRRGGDAVQQRQRGSKRRGGGAVQMRRRRGSSSGTVDPSDEAAWIRWRRRRSDSDSMDLAVATQSSSDPNGD
ncbi:hypothetical protein GUJ93_ZPchr0002g23116 [Zizania palustris]|uniref:Uncharacterized protein n=1 Tax=Zizania palustris TaxID=103762 RepID=A0A8J5RWK0_ZIZPA|nr:hypothetical protein GUJ93_ZPchr0002g23116 [Zizania palustris]